MPIQRAVYQRMTTTRLNQIRSLKCLELDRRKNWKGYFAGRDRIRLEEQITAIDAELASRKAQIRLF